jgi:F0F1-type ATP synthase delta subunit
MRTKDYSAGTFALLKEGVSPDEVLVGLKKVLKTNHHMTLYPKILNALRAAFLRDAHRGETRITLAHEADKTRLDEAITKAGKELNAHEPFTYRVDTSVIGGYRIESNGKSIDHTYKTQLRALYKSFTESL